MIEATTILKHIESQKRFKNSCQSFKARLNSKVWLRHALCGVLSDLIFARAKVESTEVQVGVDSLLVRLPFREMQ